MFSNFLTKNHTVYEIATRDNTIQCTCFACCITKPTNIHTEYVEPSWNVMTHGDAQQGKWRGKLANVVGSQYPSHYLGRWCIQHYYRWCAHLGCQLSTELTSPPPRRFKWTRPLSRKTKSGFCSCAITFQTQPNTYCFSTTVRLSERASLLRYTYIVYLVILQLYEQKEGQLIQ